MSLRPPPNIVTSAVVVVVVPSACPVVAVKSKTVSRARLIFYAPAAAPSLFAPTTSLQNTLFVQCFSTPLDYMDREMANVSVLAVQPTPQAIPCDIGACSDPDNLDTKPCAVPSQSLCRHDRFLLTRLAALHSSGLCNLSPARHADLINALASLRASVSRGVVNARPVNVVVTAYAKQPMRNLFLRTLRHATGARVIYAAYVDGDAVPARHLKQFECFISFSARPDSQLAADPDSLQNILDAFAIGACCIDLEGAYMSSAMISALERIWKGRYPYGNFDCVKNARFRQDFVRMCASRAELTRRQNVMAHTGLEFTSGNMLHLYFSGQNVYQTLQHTRRELMHIEANLSHYERRNPPPPPPAFPAPPPTHLARVNQTENAAWQRARMQPSHPGISGPFTNDVDMAREAGFVLNQNTTASLNRPSYPMPQLDPRIDSARYAAIAPALLSLDAVRRLLNATVVESDMRVFAARPPSPQPQFNNVVVSVE